MVVVEALSKIRKFFRAWVEGLLGRVFGILYNRRSNSLRPRKGCGPSIEEILVGLERAGVSSGSTLMLHSSWDNLREGGFNATDLIASLTGFLGSSGTLAMPAFPNQESKGQIFFDLDRAFSHAGWLTEVFRRFPGVERSVSLNHSVCAVGPNATYLTFEHHLGATSWDSFSPYFRLRHLDDAWVVGLGVGFGLGVATSLHCVESALMDHKYFKKLFCEEVCYDFKSERLGDGRQCYRARRGVIYPPKLARNFSADELVEFSIRGLSIYVISAKTLVDKSIELGKSGKTMYVWPIPWPWFFEN